MKLASGRNCSPPPGLIPHHYGKTEARHGRKMGHVHPPVPPATALPGPFAIAAALGAAWGCEGKQGEGSALGPAKGQRPLETAT